MQHERQVACSRSVSALRHALGAAQLGLPCTQTQELLAEEQGLRHLSKLALLLVPAGCAAPMTLPCVMATGTG